MTEYIADGIERYNFHNYFLLCWFSTSTLVVLLPCILIWDVVRRMFTKFKLGVSISLTSQDTLKKKYDSKTPTKSIAENHSETSPILTYENFTLASGYETHRSRDFEHSHIPTFKKRQTKRIEAEKISSTNQRVPWKKLYVRSALFALFTIFMDYFLYRSIDLIPVSLNYILLETDSAITFVISLVFFWKTCRKNLVFKFLLLFVILGGVVIVSFGKSASVNSTHPNYTPQGYVLGVLFGMASVILISLADTVFVYMFEDLCLRDLLLFTGFEGLNALSVFIIVLPILSILGIEILSTELFKFEILLFLSVASIFQIIFVVLNSLLLQYVGSPFLFSLLCMVLEGVFSSFYDHFFLSITYSWLVWLGWGVILSGVVFENFFMVVPDLDVRTRLIRLVKPSCVKSSMISTTSSFIDLMKLEDGDETALVDSADIL